ncbi:MAG: GH92 family glycosyl hydrolase [Clostridium sp.]|nr:GH92 family glycosyl hydrolase [Clostridium sp.]
MNRLRFLFATILLTTLAAGASDPVDHVVTLMGSMSDRDFSAGNTYPAVALPWGMNFWTPQTGAAGDGWAYTYGARKIRGIKQTHQPSPWINDYGQFSLMPVSGVPRFDEESRASWFTHKTETARPYLYSVYLADADALAEVTPTERGAMIRMTFYSSDSAMIAVDGFPGGSEIAVDTSAGEVLGVTRMNSGGVPEGFANWFVISFDRPVAACATVSDGRTLRSDSTVSEGPHAGALIGFERGDRSKPLVVTARVASSFIDHDQARRNMGELGDGFDFDRVCRDARQRWNDILGRVKINDSEDPDRLNTFYTCLYRSVLFPRTFYEIDRFGTPVHRSPYNGRILPGYMFTDTGFWDTFRSLFPLLNLLYPSMNAKMQQGLVHAYRESGFLPEWASPGHRDCMVGNNSASVVADAAVKGVEGYDLDALWEAVTHGAQAVHPEVRSTGRLGHEYYNRLGYVPCDVSINESAARTLEYAYDDWCIYQFGLKLKKNKKELAPYGQRALNYTKLFNPGRGLMAGRRSDGSFPEDFNPLKWGGDFTEGNSWHYTWSVFHDPAGLIALMGGREAFNARLDSIFSVRPVFDDSYYGGVIHEIREMQVANMGNYAHGNQPAQHVPYLYCYSGQPWKTQFWVREVMTRLYSPTPDGYCGDEDNGQTSAWYVFSALGFYPVCPGTDQYVVGAPLFKSATLTFENGNHLDISAPQNSDVARYINRMSLNNRNIEDNFLTHKQLTSGGLLKFIMSHTPNIARGTEPKNAPYSFSD